MADRYVRDDIGRFAPTGKAKVTPIGRRRAGQGPTPRKGTQKRATRALKRSGDNRFVIGSARGEAARTRSVEGKRVLEAQTVNAYQRGKVNGAGAVAIQRTGFKSGTKGTVKKTNVNSVVLKLKKNGLSANGPSVSRSVRASAARGVQVAANARYVSNRETSGPIGNVISRANVARASATGRPLKSGYLVINSLG